MVDRRLVKAAGKALTALTTSKEPLQVLKAARRLRELAEALETAAVYTARDAGATWGDIGNAYGMSKQAVQQRFQRRGHKPKN